MFGIREPLLPARSPCASNSNIEANKWFARFGVFFTYIGMLVPFIYLVHKAYLFLTDSSNFKPDFPVIIAVFVVLFVCSFAAYAQKSRNRAGYYPIIAFFWFVKYGSIATVANNLSMILVRNASNITVDNDVNQLSIWLILTSLMAFVVSSFLHYIYWANYKLNGSQNCEPAAVSSTIESMMHFNVIPICDDEC